MHAGLFVNSLKEPFHSAGLTISLNGDLDDFKVLGSNSDTNRALRCQSELPSTDVTQFTQICLVGDGSSPISCKFKGPKTIQHAGTVIRGWSGTRDVKGGRRVHYLRKRIQTPEEGYFNCNFGGSDLNDPSGLYILYPSEYYSHFC